MTSMRNLILIMSVGIALAVTGSAIGVWRQKVQAAETEKAWKKLAALVPDTAPSSTNGDVMVKSDWLVSVRSGDSGASEVGQLALKDGSKWQFAFASHHVLERPESFVVFKSGSNWIRAQGHGFCCEVEFDGSNQPVDAADLLRQLKNDFKFTTSAYGSRLEQK